jgi:NAD(P)-dependent dehydrogenase (short-subunit alcohol dehydrogenase family)
LSGVPPTPADRVVVITGCSTGIGRASAVAFRRAGWTTIATARRVETLAALEAEGCEIATLDVTSDDDRQRVIADVLARHGRIDALVNNAGYAEYGPLEEVSLERWRTQFETNLFALVALTQLVAPSMRERGAGRVINVSSMGGVITLPLGAAYHGSKFAVEAMSDVARFELAPFGIQVVVIEPGVVLSNFAEPAMTGLAVGVDSPYAELAASFASILQRTYARRRLTNVSPERIARTIVRAATVARPRTRYRLPLQARALVATRRLLPDRLYDAVIRSQVR